MKTFVNLPYLIFVSFASSIQLEHFPFFHKHGELLDSSSLAFGPLNVNFRFIDGNYLGSYMVVPQWIKTSIK